MGNLKLVLALLLSLSTGPMWATGTTQRLVVSAALSNLQRSTTNNALAYQALYILAAESSDMDGDGAIESPAMSNVGGAGTPTSGGNVPLTSAAPKSDGYGSTFGFCSWDNGTVTGSLNRIAGANNPAKPTVAIIASGPNGVFDTTCANIFNGAGAQGDDIVVSYSGTQLQLGVNSNLYVGNPVASLAALLALDPASLYDGQVRITKDTNTMYRWNGPSNAWQPLSSSSPVVTASRVLVSDAAGLVSASTIAHSGGTFSGLVNLFATGNIGTTGSITSPIFNGALNGNASTASALQTIRTISMTGDGTWSTNFDGSGNVTGGMALANTGVVAGTYGSATAAPIFTVDSKGRLTAAGSATITPAWASITGIPAPITTYAAFMNQNVRSVDAPTFAGLTVSGPVTATSFNSHTTQAGSGALLDATNQPYAYNMNQWVRTTDAPTFAALTVSGPVTATSFNGHTTQAGSGALLDATNQPYAYNMNQWVRTTDSPTFAGLTVNGQLSAGSGNFVVSPGGVVTTIQGYSPPNGAMRMTPYFHLNSMGGYAVIVNWDNGTTGNSISFKVGNGAGGDAFYVTAAGNVVTSGNVAAASFNSHATQAGSGTLLDATNQPYAYNMNQWVRTTDSPTFAGLTVNGQLSAGSGNFVVAPGGGVPTIQGYSPANGAIRMTPNFHLNSLGGYAVIVNWDNGTTGNSQTFRIGNGSSGGDVFYVTAAGNVVTSGNVAAASFNNHTTQGGTGALLDATNQPYAYNMNQWVRTTDSPTFASLTVNGSISSNTPNIVVYTTSGYLYRDASNSFGFLNNTANWAVRVNAGGANSGGSLYGSWDATNLTVGGSQVLHAGNYSSYAIARGGDTVDSVINFRSNKGAGSYVGSQSSYALEAFSNDGGAAGMSFHRGGAYAVNMGLDPDNVLRIGGWTAPANRWQLDMAGNQTVAGNSSAASFNSHTTQGGTGALLDATNQPYAYNMNQWVRTTDAPTFTDVYTSTGWFRNNAAGTGLYSASSGNHWYSDGALWNTATGGANGGIAMRQGYNGPIQGYLYWDSNGSGLLNSGGNWAVRANPGGANAGGQLYGTWDATNMTVGGNQVLHAGNFNSYSPTLTGGGASGTWNIDVSGRAARLSGIGTNPDGSHPGYGANTFYSWNTGQANNAGAGFSNGISIGSHPGDPNYGFQIVQNMWDDNLYFRRFNYGWQGWRRALNNVEDVYAANMNQYVRTSDAPTFAGLTLTGNLAFSAANPVITSGGSYVTIPNGIYVSGGTPYFQPQIVARGGIRNDSAADLVLAGGTSGITTISGVGTVATFDSTNGVTLNAVGLKVGATQVIDGSGYIYAANTIAAAAGCSQIGALAKDASGDAYICK